MRILYLECGMGAAGDMLTAALLELLDEKQAFLDRMNALGLPGVQISAGKAIKCGIVGTQMTVLVDGVEEESRDVHTHSHAHPHHAHGPAHEHPHHHTGMREIEHMIGHLEISGQAKENALAVYQLIAEAESRAHDCPVEEIHFHEVGTADAVADITAVCLLLEELAPDKIIASPVAVGSGHVHCAHGILPVPAPATAYLLRGIPTCSGNAEGELCTPTGAALLRHFADEFGKQPVMRVGRIGCGMGKKDFPQANCVRAMLGEAEDGGDQIAELRCNLDDMTAEDIAFATERLLEAGALDVYTAPIGMKKSRSGTLLTCLCRPAEREEMVRLLFRHTTTLGVRESIHRRYTLSRAESVRETPYGAVRVKTASGWGVRREKPEYDDLVRLARETGRTLAELREMI